MCRANSGLAPRGVFVLNKQKFKTSLTSVNVKKLVSLQLFVRKKHNLIHMKPILKCKQEIGMQIAEKHDHEIKCPNS